MTNEAATIGIEMQTDGVERGIRVLKSLADAGPRVEKAMGGIATAAAKANASMGKMGGDATGLNAVGKAADDAAKKLGWYRDAQGRMRDESGRFVSVARQVEQGLAGIASESAQTATGMQSMASSASSAASAFGLMRAGIQAFIGLQVVGWAKDSAAALYEASAAAERLRIGLDFASTRGSATEIAYLRTTTESLGLAFSDTAKAYMQFQAAAKGTSLEGDKARSVFEAISKASAVMGLSADQSAGALMALQQMVSKGTVQAEELRGQLGERLPGAFQIAARSMGVTTAELGKMLEMGQVVADDFLPKFAAELEKSLGDSAERAADRLDAAVNRFDNAWQKLKQTAGDSGVSKAIASEMNAISRDLQAVDDAIASASAQGSGAFSALAQGALVAAGRTGFATLNLAANTLNGTLNLLTGGVLDLRTDLAVLPGVLQSNSEKLGTLQAEAAAAEQNLAHLQSLGAQFGNEVWYQNEIARTKKVAAEYRAALADRLALTGGSGLAGAYTEGMGNSQAITQQRVRFDAAEQFLLSKSADANGVNKKFVEDLKGYADALDAGAISATGYAKAITELNKKRHESTEAGKAEAAALKESSKGAKAGETAYQSLAGRIQDYIAQLKLEAEQGGKVTTAQKLQIDLDNLLIKSKGKVTAAKLAQSQADIAIARAMEEANIASKREATQADEAAKAYESVLDATLKRVDSVRDQIEAEKDAAAAIGLSAVELAQLEAAKLNDLAASRERQAALMDDIDLSGTQSAALRAEAQAYRDLAAAKGQRAVKQANKDTADQAAKDWERVSQTIGDTLADYIMGGGKDAATYLKRLFSTLVLQPVVQYGVNSAMGALGMGQQGSAVNSVLGGNNVGTTVLNNAGAIGAGFQAMYGMSVGASSASLLGANAVGMVGGDALGALIAGNGAWAGVAVEAGATAGAAAGVAAAEGAAAGAASTAGGLMSGIAAAAPWIAGALALYSIAKSFDDSGTLHYGAGAVYSGGKLQTGADIYNRDTFGMGSRGEWNANAQQNASGIAASLGAALDGFAIGFGQKAGYTVATAFADDSSDDGAWGSLRIADALGNALVDWENSRSSKWAPKEFASGDEGYQQYLNAVAVDVKSAFLAMDIPAWGKQLVDAATDLDSLSAALAQVGTVKTVLDSLGKSMQMFADLSGDAQTTLLNTSGGIDALAKNASSFYQGFYSEQERMENLRQQVNRSLADLGVAPLNALDAFGANAKERFSAEIEHIFETGNAEVGAAMLSLSEQFAVAANYAEKEFGSASDAIREAAQAMAELSLEAQSIVDAQRDSLEGLIASLKRQEQQTSGGYIGNAWVSGDEFAQFSGFADQLDSATAALSELESLGLGDEMQQYADAIGQIVDETKSLLASELSAKRLFGGDFAGALAAAISNSMPKWEGTAGGFNSALAEVTGKAAAELYSTLSANALRIGNAGEGLQMLSGAVGGQRESAYTSIWQGIRQEFSLAAGDALYGIVGALSAQAVGAPGSAGVGDLYAAQSSMADYSEKFEFALSRLEGELRIGAIAAEEYERAVEFVNGAYDASITAANNAAAAYEQVAESSLNHYFADLSRIVSEMGDAAQKANTELAQTANAIGLLNSITTAFGESARAASSYDIARASEAQLIAESAAIASGIMTTASAAQAAQELASKLMLGEGQTMRDLSLLVDGVSQYDSTGFYQAFAKISDALGQGGIDENQYKTLFDYMIGVYDGSAQAQKDAAAAAQQVSDRFESLADAMKSFSDDLLIGDKTTLNPAQTLSEMQRQYVEAYKLAKGGDLDAARDVERLGKAMLDKGMYSNQAEYNANFGRIYGDARVMENFARAQQNPVVEKLEAMTQRVSELERNLTAALAQIAKNTANTANGVESLNLSTPVPA